MRNIKICCILMLLCFLLLGSVSFASRTKTADTCIEGHTLEKVGESEPTCLNSGFIVYGCKYCTYTESNYVLPRGHVFTTKIDKTPTCLEDGVAHEYCKFCGLEKEKYPLLRSNYKPMELLHDYEYHDTIPAHCSGPFTLRYVCSICGAIKEYTKGENNPNKHLVLTHLEDVPATCTENAYSSDRCFFCQKTIKTETGEKALGHDLGTFSVLRKATCTKDGSGYKKCKRAGCDYKEYSIISKGHEFIKNKTLNATCSNPKTDYYKCKYCSETKEDKIGKALGHDLKFVIDKKATCTESGLGHYECKRAGCNYTQTKKINKLEHNYSILINKIEPTTAKAGSVTYECSMCKKATKTTTLAKLPASTIPKKSPSTNEKLKY